MHTGILPIDDTDGDVLLSWTKGRLLYFPGVWHDARTLYQLWVLRSQGRYSTWTSDFGMINFWFLWVILLSWTVSWRWFIRSDWRCYASSTVSSINMEEIKWLKGARSMFQPSSIVRCMVGKVSITSFVVYRTEIYGTGPWNLIGISMPSSGKMMDWVELFAMSNNLGYSLTMMLSALALLIHRIEWCIVRLSIICVVYVCNMKCFHLF